MTKREARVEAMNMIGTIIDNLKQGDWKCQFSPKDLDKIIKELNKIESKFLLIK